MLFEYDILSGGPCILLLNHPMSIYKQVWLPKEKGRKADHPFPRYREGRAEQLDTTGYEAWELTWEETFTHNKHTSYLVIIPGFKPIVSDELPRGSLDALLWSPQMTVESFDQWGMETHEWQFKRKYWLFGPWVGYLNGEKVGENSQILWQKYLLEKYDPFN
jgi:hypothetical protein|nr:MAG TPA: hypothetical protein [Caudoviricetes sp.]